jgi:hypothetical protein
LARLDRRAALVAALALIAPLGGVAPARATDPIMPLAQVRSGMGCTGLSVVRGTEIASFDVEVLDVVRGAALADGPAILVRVSGPAVDATGVGPGFSGSPVLCPDAAGTPRTAGAIAYGVGEYGNRIALATPIEAMLGEPVRVPRGARRAPPVVRSARALVGPFTVSGIRPALAARLGAAARRHGRELVAAPSAPAAPPSSAPLRPGSAVAVGLVSGDLWMGAVGTVTYRDGDAVWAFGHPLESAGARSLLLQEAYVYGVVSNPVGAGDLATHKLAAPGRTVGTLTNDALAAVVGRVGPLPRRVPLSVSARDLDTGRRRHFRVEIADEGRLATPGRVPVLPLAGAMAILQADAAVLRGVPYHLASACVRFTVEELPEPFGYCNRYSGGGETGPGHADDYALAAALIEGYGPGRLHLQGVDVRLEVRRGVHEAEILEARAPARARPGQRVPVSVVLRRHDGARQRVRVPVRVPRSLRPGRRTLVVNGASGREAGKLEELLFAEAGSSDMESPRDVARRVEAIGRYDGLRAGFAGGRGGERVYRDPALLITGRARASLRVAPRR